ARPDPSFFHADNELRATYSFLHDALRSRPGFYLLTGGPGHGKTALLDRLVEDLRSSGCEVIFGQREGLPANAVVDLASNLISPQEGEQPDSMDLLGLAVRRTPRKPIVVIVD